MSFIEFEGVTFLYQGKKILDDVSFSIDKGEFVSIIGKNGSGKSVLTRHMNGLILPTYGNVIVDGMNTKDASKIYDIRRKVGLAFQDPDDQIVAGTVEEDVAFGLSNLGILRDSMRKRVDDSLKKVGIFKYIFNDVDTLSGGTKQKLVIAGVLAMGAECLVLDEPTSMLDQKSCQNIMNELLYLNKKENITIILLTHHIEEAKLANRILILDSGKLVLQGSNELLDDNLKLSIFNNKIKLDKPKKRCILEFKNIYFKYEKNDKYTLDNISFKIYENEIIGIVGDTGTGKSTIARLIKGILAPTSGNILVNGNFCGVSDLKKTVGIVFQFSENQLFAETVIEDVCFGPKNLGFSEELSLKKSFSALDLVGFDKNKINFSPFALSGGEKKLVSIAGILAMDPEILIFDEPTAGLDAFSRNKFINMILELNKTIVMISHSKDEINAVSDRIFEVKDSQLHEF